MTSTINLMVGGLRVDLEGSHVAARAIERWIGAFATPTGGDPDMRLAIAFGDDASPERLALSEGARLSWNGSSRVEIVGDVRGWYDMETRRGSITGAADLGAVELLLRVALAVTLPSTGRLLLHAATLPAPPGAVVLCGDSDTGKSTAARWFHGASDELAVIRPEGGSVQAWSTPYWQGRPYDGPCTFLVCLAKGGTPALTRLRGAAALAELSHHVVRHLAIPEVDAAILRLLADACSCVEIVRAMCPEGEAFQPFLGSALGLVPA